MNDWQEPMESAFDDALRRALNSPEWQNLPGQGNPLSLGDDPNTPDGKKLAYKILKENDLAPDWMIEGKALEYDREKLVAQLQQAGTLTPKLRDALTQFNKRALTFNLKVPQGVQHKRLINPAHYGG